MCYDVQKFNELCVLGRRALSLDGCRDVPFLDAGLMTLRSLASVVALNLQGCTTLTDLGLQAVARMTALASVNLQDCCQITGAHPGHYLRQCPSYWQTALKYS